MIDTATWGLYVATEVVMCALPGPAVLTTVAQALGGGATRAAGNIAGINLGNLVWYALAGAGLTALLLASHHLFQALKIAGIAYLLWLGGRALFRGGGGLVLAAERPVRFWRGAASGLAVQLANPKALLFFTVLLPPFIDPAAPIVPQIALLAATGVVVEVLVLSLYALAAARAARLVRRPDTGRLLDRIAGCLLLGAGVGLAVQART